MISAFCRLRRQSVLTKKQYDNLKRALPEDIEDIFVCNIVPEVISQAIYSLETNSLRTLDALPIGCALEWGAEAFVSSDMRQISAARIAGLKVWKV